MYTSVINWMLLIYFTLPCSSAHCTLASVLFFTVLCPVISHKTFNMIVFSISDFAVPTGKYVVVLLCAVKFVTCCRNLKNSVMNILSIILLYYLDLYLSVLQNTALSLFSNFSRILVQYNAEPTITILRVYYRTELYHIAIHAVALDSFSKIQTNQSRLVYVF